MKSVRVNEKNLMKKDARSLGRKKTNEGVKRGGDEAGMSGMNNSA